MSYTGEVRNGVIVLENGAELPEGMRVRIEALTQDQTVDEAEAAATTLGQRLLRFAGAAGKGLPRDLARNHDHYLHGMPKK